MLQGQVRGAIPPAGSVNGHDRRVGERRPQIGGTPEPSLPFFPRAHSGREDLQSDGLLEWAGQGMVDGTSRPSADLVNNLIAVSPSQARQSLPRAERHGSNRLAFQEPV